MTSKSMIADLWKQYAAERTIKLRNELVEAYRPFVRTIAATTRSKFPANIEQEDFESAGMFGLISAIESFDISRGWQFKTYASKPIRGAMLDEVRKLDWVPRLVRSKESRLRRARDEFNAAHGRAPEHNELAARLGITESALEELLRDVRPVTVDSLSRKWYETDSGKGACVWHILVDRHSPDPQQRLGEINQLGYLTRGLNRDERILVLCYYCLNMTMKEIGKTLNMSESRVSQMHSQIIEFIKERIDPELALVG